MPLRNICKFLSLILLPLSLMCSCSDSNDDPTPPDNLPRRRAVIIYMAAQNSLGHSGAARLDSAEIYSGMSKLPGNSADNVFLFIDDKKLPRLYRLYKYRNRTIQEKIMTWQTDLCSTDPATLRDIISLVATRYPSECYGLVLWSHGNGWLDPTNEINTLGVNGRAFGIDVGPDGNLSADTDSQGKTGPQMSITSMAEAISRTGVHFDYIFFDACQMQCVETAYELRHVTDYVVGSACTTSAYGGYYTSLLPNALCAYPTNDANAALIARQYFYDAVENPDLKKYYGTYGNVISTIKTSGLDALASATAQHIARVFADKAEPDLSDAQTYCSSRYFNIPDLYDMGSVMKNTLSDQDYTQWLSVANRCVISHHGSESFVMGTVNGSFPIINRLKEHTLGVSMFVPRRLFTTSPYTNYNLQFHSTSWYSAAGWNQTGW